MFTAKSFTQIFHSFSRLLCVDLPIGKGIIIRFPVLHTFHSYLVIPG